MVKHTGIHVLFIAASLDGYIADSDDSLDWLFEVQGDGDNGYSDFIRDVDCVVLGRKTYDWIIKETKNDFPYKNQVCFVFSNTQDTVEHAQVVREDFSLFVKRIKNQYRKIWIVGGGELIRNYINLNEIDEYRITIAPVILGSGIKLFNEINTKIKLTLIESTVRNQFAELVYKKV